jgi:hypothetical protein
MAADETRETGFGEVHALDVRGRAVLGLRDREIMAGVDGAAEPQAARQFGCQIREDVAEHVGVTMTSKAAGLRTR